MTPPEKFEPVSDAKLEYYLDKPLGDSWYTDYFVRNLLLTLQQRNREVEELRKKVERAEIQRDVLWKWYEDTTGKKLAIGYLNGLTIEDDEVCGE